VLALVTSWSPFSDARVGAQTRGAQTRGAQPSAAAQKLPPLVYVCTMPGDEAVLEDKPGKCPNPKCGMELVPVRLDSKFWCPTHQSLVVRDAAGKCPLDGKDLVQVTLSMTWKCGDDKFTEPGKCANGQERKIAYEIRAHGDHNPKHDGQFFMAADAWHHLEGTYPSAGLFRAFFYDNFTKPLPAKAFTGTITVYDSSATVDKPIGSFPLKAGRSADVLEATIAKDASNLPLKVSAFIKFKPELQPQRFDFLFSKHSQEPKPAAPAATTTRATTPAAPRAAAPAAAPSAAAKPAAPAAAAARPATPAVAPARPAASPTTTAPAQAQSTQAAPAQAAQTPPPAQTPNILDSPLQIPPGLAEALDESKLPTDTKGLLDTLTSRAKEVETLVSEGNLAQVWLPATGTKTVALVLDSHAASLPERQRVLVSAAVKRVVAAAWQLDAYGDLGNRQKISEAYQRLAAAVTDLKTAYTEGR
jgi:hypothetical protein